jgi:hypothetical protein
MLFIGFVKIYTIFYSIIYHLFWSKIGSWWAFLNLKNNSCIIESKIHRFAIFVTLLNLPIEIAYKKIIITSNTDKLVIKTIYNKKLIIIL